MNIELLISYLPWITAIIGVVATFFIVHVDGRNFTELYSNYVVFFSGLLSSIIAYSFLEYPNNLFISVVFICGALGSLTANSKTESISSLVVSMFVALAFNCNNQSLAIIAVSFGLIVSAFSLSFENRKSYLAMASIVSVLAVLGSCIPVLGGTFFITLFVVWVAFIYPFSMPLSYENSTTNLILRLSVLVVGALSIRDVNVHLIWIVGISIVVCSIKALLEKDRNVLIYLSASSSAVLFLQPNPNPYCVVSHALAITGMFFATSENALDKTTRVLLAMSLAGVPLLGGFWCRWDVIKYSNKLLISLFIVLNSASWMYFIVKNNAKLDVGGYKSPFNRIIVTVCLIIIIWLGIRGI